MKTTLSEREGNTVKLEVEVSSEELQEAFDRQLKKLTQEARIPGFRPGKVPATMVRQRVGDEAIMTEAIEAAMVDWLKAAGAEAAVEPVDSPQIDVGEEVPQPGQPLSFTATMTVMPEVILGDYKGIEAVKETVEVTDEELDEQTERLREEFAELRPVEDRPIKAGDFVIADFSATFEGEPVGSLETTDFAFEAGSGRLFPEIEAETLGMVADEERTFKLNLPDEFDDDEVAGKEVDFMVKVKEIKEKILPDFTDEWAAEMSEFSTMAELREDIRKKIKGKKEYEAHQRFRSAAVDAVADTVTIDVPDVLVKEHATEMATDFAQTIGAQGTDIRLYLKLNNLTPDQLVEDLKPQAAKNVKAWLVLDAVAKAEELRVTDIDFNMAIQQMASATQTDPNALEDRLRKSNRLESLRQQLLREKAADFIARHAVAVDAPPEPEVAAEPVESTITAEPSSEMAVASQPAPEAGQAAEGSADQTDQPG
ncbi:MAG: trigger factor [Thermoleophilia bacterium]